MSDIFFISLLSSRRKQTSDVLEKTWQGLETKVLLVSPTHTVSISNAKTIKWTPPYVANPVLYLTPFGPLSNSHFVF